MRIVNRISRIATRCFTLGDQAFHQPPLSALSSTFLPFNFVVDLAIDLAIVLVIDILSTSHRPCLTPKRPRGSTWRGEQTAGRQFERRRRQRKTTLTPLLCICFIVFGLRKYNLFSPATGYHRLHCSLLHCRHLGRLAACSQPPRRPAVQPNGRPAYQPPSLPR